jgi:hypothetical protein
LVRWFSGGLGEEETPGPIPNPEAKLFSADGTALEGVWESRTPPEFTYSKGFHPTVEPLTALYGFVYAARLLIGRRRFPLPPGTSEVGACGTMGDAAMLMACPFDDPRSQSHVLSL